MRRPPVRLALVRRHPKFLRQGRPKGKTEPLGFVGTKIAPELHDRLIAVAQREGVSISAYLRALITERLGSTVREPSRKSAS